jgi:hypothetical protein
MKVGVLSDISVGSLRGLLHLKVVEVLFVVGDFEQFARTRDINFVAPSQPRTSMSNAFSQYEKRDRTGLSEDLARDGGRSAGRDERFQGQASR